MKSLFSIAIIIGLTSCASHQAKEVYTAFDDVFIPTRSRSKNTNGTLRAMLDEQDRLILQKTSPSTLEKIEEGDPLFLDDVIALYQGGISDDVIIQYIHHTRSSYRLSHEQIRKLKNAGISEKLINYMIDTGR